MIRNLWLFCLLSVNFFYGQKVEILNKSGFEHNYVVKSMEYIENVNDTSKLKYIATLRINGKLNHYTGNVVRWAVKFEEVAKKMGANSFCLQDYFEKDSMGTLTINVYFAGTNFLKANKQQANKNNVYLFSPSTYPNDSAYFYLNSTKKILLTKSYIINTVLNTDYNIAVTENKLTNLLVKYKSEKKSRYFIIPKLKTANSSA
ncbi:MAG TPA: hypothetical protein VKG26_02850, partial [Bacteroidia bacterium]|nr:hypothetical protein [Bacteroidia bacterium]